jgi:hypothetical protein
MWFLLLLIGLLGFLLFSREGFTDLSPRIVRTTIQSNQVDIDAQKVNVLEELIDRQSDQLTQINSIIATLKAQKNSV